MREHRRQRCKQSYRDDARSFAEQSRRPDRNDRERQQKKRQIAGARDKEIVSVTWPWREHVTHPFEMRDQRERDSRQRRVLRVAIEIAALQPALAAVDMNRLIYSLAENAIG